MSRPPLPLLLILLLAACGDPAGRCVDALGAERPQWLSSVPRDSQSSLYRVGRAEHGARAEAVRAAEKDAARQLVEQHYGQELERQWQRVRTQVESVVIERLASSSAGAVAGATQRAVWWERCETPGEGFEFRAAALIQVERSTFLEAVRRWIESSPPVVQARALEKRARGLAERHASESRSGMGARAFAGVARAWTAVRRAARGLDAASTRYRELLGRDLPVAGWDRTPTAVGFRRRVSEMRLTLRVGIEASDRRLGQAIGRALGVLGIATVTGGCGVAPVALDAHADKPVCQEAGMHSSCSLPIRLELRECEEAKILVRARLDGPETRGAAMNATKAAARAWANLMGQNREGLRKALGRAIGDHLLIEDRL